MATASQIQELQNIVGQINGLNRDTLIKREKWGEISFEKSKGEFSQIFWFSDQIKSYPLDTLPDSVASTMLQSLNDTYSKLKAIDSFSINQGNPSGTSAQLSQELHSSVDRLFLNCAQWIPFLAHQNGDVVRNINALVERTKEAEQILEGAKAHCSGKRDEVQKIVQEARDASAGAGAAVFTQNFSEESVKLEKDARKWLIATVVMIAGTVSLAAVFWGFTEAGLDQGQVFQKLTTKLFVLALMLTGTLWCGKCYKALTHLVIVNRHRALSLLTLQAFANAASDSQTKDAVLLEATRSIFGNVPTGYVDSLATDNDHKVVEIIRSGLPKS